MAPSVISTATLPPALLAPARLIGYTPSIVSSFNKCVSYSLYIPEKHYNPNPEPKDKNFALQCQTYFVDSSQPVPPLPILVLMHGTSRQTTALLNAFQPLADKMRCALLAPLFPAGLNGPNDWDSYKQVRSPSAGVVVDNMGDVDVALLHIIREDIPKRWPGLYTTGRFLLAGFSGGASYAQRFALLNPHHVLSVSIAAPGTLARVIRKVAMSRQTNNMEERTSMYTEDIDWDNCATMSWQLVVGSEDNALEGSLERLAMISEGWDDMDPEIDWVQRAKDQMRTRQSQLEEFKDKLNGQGVEVELEIVKGGGHVLSDLAPAMSAFLSKWLQEVWQSPTLLDAVRPHWQSRSSV